MIRCKTVVRLETIYLIIIMKILTVSMDIRLPLRYVEKVPPYNKSRECLFGSEIKKPNSTWMLNLNHLYDNKSCFKCECRLKSVPPPFEGKFLGVVRCQKHEPICPKLNCLRSVYMKSDCCKHCLNDIDATNRKKHDLLEKFGDSYCTHEGHEYAEKSTWKSRIDSCQTYSCQDGVVRSERVKCPKLNCRPNEFVDRDYRLRPNQCCPICKSNSRNSIASTMLLAANSAQQERRGWRKDGGTEGAEGTGVAGGAGEKKLTHSNKDDNGCYLGEQFYTIHSEIQPIETDPCTVCYCEKDAKIRCKRHQCDMLKNDYNARYVVLSRFEKQCFLHCFNKTKHSSRDFIPIRLKFNERKVFNVRPLSTRHRTTTTTTTTAATTATTTTFHFRAESYRNRHYISNRIIDRYENKGNRRIVAAAAAAALDDNRFRRNRKQFSFETKNSEQDRMSAASAVCRLPSGSTIQHGSRFNPIVSSFVEKNIVCKCRKSILRCRFRDQSRKRPRIAATSIMTRIATIMNNRNVQKRQQNLHRNFKKSRTKKSQLILQRRRQNPF